MDRQGILMEQFQDEKPIHPKGTLRRSLERVGGLVVLIGGTALKFGFIFVKFFGFFISVAAYTLWFHSWTFALGFVLMILMHELGHVAEARRQGLKVSWPTFIPFFGAYVTIERAGLTPWKNALISLAGPFFGGAAAALVWAIGSARGSTQLEVLANIAFLLNAFNMLPIGFLDGGQTIARGARGVAHAAHPVRSRRADRGVRAGSGARTRDRRPLPRARGAARDRDARDAAERRRSVRWRTGDSSTSRTTSQDELRENTARIAEEFYEGFEAVERIDRPAVSIFGSARAPGGLGAYAAARETGKLFAEAGWAVITGGGPGVMEAANRGCREGGGLSVGFNIELPHEQHENPYLDISLDVPPLLRAQDDVREAGARASSSSPAASAPPTSSSSR